jgi:hypothetical protein
VTQAAVIALLAYPVILAFKPLIYKLFAATGIPQSQMGPQKDYFDILIYAAIFGLSQGDVQRVLFGYRQVEDSE